ncbi:MAG: sulfotransferase domain-containing protein [Phycisphaerales bacterium]|nr:sulfotransferase domain-containing protein [Phycisphaerales bacterium]
MPTLSDPNPPLIVRAMRSVPSRKFQRFVYQRAFHYPHRNILVIGQPKAGTTWLTRLVCEIPGYVRWTPGSIKLDKHDFHPGDLDPPAMGYTITKVHTPPTGANIKLIHAANRPYLVITRDPRDLAVSWAYYNTLPGRTRVAHPQAQSLPVEGRIAYYIDNILEGKIEWALQWRKRLHPTLGMFIRYEDLLADPFPIMRRAYAHILGGEPEVSDNWVRAAIERNSFKKVTGREQGEADAKNFNRKGISGDWQNHFTPDHIASFKRIAGDALVLLGYEQDNEWGGNDA